MFMHEMYVVLLQILGDPATLIGCVLGVIWGIIFGAAPGLSTTMSLSILVPLTFGVETTRAIAFLMGAYFGGVYGGSLSAILINIPGTPSAIMTTLDGHPMAKRGEAGRAIGLATIASCLGGLFSLLCLGIFAPLIARFALTFSAEEYVALALFGLSVLAYISPGNTLKGLASGVMGLLVATVGADPMTAYPRFTFGSAHLYGGLSIVPVCIGLFGLSEILTQLEEDKKVVIEQRIRNIIPRATEFIRMRMTILRSAVIGTIIGAIPAAGSSIAAAVSYAQEKRYSSHPEQLGNGAAEGVVAPETANNASVGGALIPMLTLGIPGDPMTAVLIGALLIHGLRPGPLLFKEHPDFVATVVVTLGIAIVLTCILGLSCARIFARLISIPKHFLIPAILVMCVVGSYAEYNSLFDVGVMLAFGVLGYAMTKVNMPIAPAVLGFVLGPILEDNLRRALMLSGGSLMPFVTRPITALLLVLTVLTLSASWLRSVVARRRGLSMPSYH